jgi:hypothetical protein
MTGGERDPEADLRALTEAVNEEFRLLADAVKAWLERNRPAIEALAELAQDPRAQDPRVQACHCLCARTHPGEYVCDAEAVTTRRYNSPALGPVDVPVCAPCMVAQGIAEAGR